jgi:hypothetical protein
VEPTALAQLQRQARNLLKLRPMKAPTGSRAIGTTTNAAKLGISSMVLIVLTAGALGACGSSDREFGGALSEDGSGGAAGSGASAGGSGATAGAGGSGATAGSGGTSASGGTTGSGGDGGAPSCSEGQRRCGGDVGNTVEECRAGGWAALPGSEQCGGNTPACTGNGVCAAYRLALSTMGSSGAQALAAGGAAYVLRRQMFSTSLRACNLSHCTTGDVRP